MNFQDAIYFDGKDDYIEIADAGVETEAIGGPITIRFWNLVRIEDLRDKIDYSAFCWNGPLFPERCGCHAPWGDGRLYWDYGEVGDLSNEMGRLSVNYTPYLGQWTHITLVSEGRGGAFQAIYLNGKPVAGKEFSDGPSVRLEGVDFGRGTIDSQGNYAYHRGAMRGFVYTFFVLPPEMIEEDYRRSMELKHP